MGVPSVLAKLQQCDKVKTDPNVKAELSNELCEYLEVPEVSLDRQVDTPYLTIAFVFV